MGPGEPAGLPMARGVQAGSAIRSNFLRAREQRIHQEQFQAQMQARSEAAAIENQMHRQQLEMTRLQVAQLAMTRGNRLAAETDLAGLQAHAGSLGDTINTPDGVASLTSYFATHSRLFEHPQALGMLESAQKATELRTRMLDATSTRPLRPENTPDAIQIGQEKARLRLLADQARTSGDTTAYQEILKQIADIDAQTQKGQTIRTFSESGQPLVEVTSGGAAPTTTMQTAGQKRIVGYEVAIEGIQDVLGKLRPDDVGIKGIIGENVFDTWMEQFKPGTRSTERIQNRDALRMISEQLIEAVSADTSGRFSDADVKRLREVTGSVGASKSIGEIKDRLSETSRILRDRARTYAERTGQPVPDFSKSTDEIKGEYQRQLTAIERDATENRISQQQALELKTASYNRLANALRRYHGLR